MSSPNSSFALRWVTRARAGTRVPAACAARTALIWLFAALPLGVAGCSSSGGQSGGLPSPSGLPSPAGLPGGQPGGTPSGKPGGSQGSKPSGGSQGSDSGEGSSGGASGGGAAPSVIGPKMPGSGGGVPGGSGGEGGAGGGGGAGGDGSDASGDPSATADGSRLPTPVFKQPKPSSKTGDDAADGSGADASTEPGAYGEQTAGTGNKGGNADGKGDDGELDQVLGSIDQRMSTERERIRERAEEIGATGKLPTPDDAIGAGAGSASGNAEADGDPTALPQLPSPVGSPQDVQARGPAIAPPADIPDDPSDDVLGRQLREAATYEPDPELRARLWNEYRLHKRNRH